jgi:hypothetical protein
VHETKHADSDWSLLVILAVVFGGVEAFLAIAATVQPGLELGLAGAALGINCGLACATIGVCVNRAGRLQETAPPERVVA